MFFTFDQNNSGGDFIVDDALTRRVIIEAASEEDAIARATELGVYFDGVWDGIDCECCGNRWGNPNAATESPEFDYFRLVEDRLTLISEETPPDPDRISWVNPEAIIHFADGRIRRVMRQEVNTLVGK